MMQQTTDKVSWWSKNAKQGFCCIILHGNFVFCVGVDHTLCTRSHGAIANGNISLWLLKQTVYITLNRTDTDKTEELVKMYTKYKTL